MDTFSYSQNKYLSTTSPPPPHHTHALPPVLVAQGNVLWPGAGVPPGDMLGSWGGLVPSWDVLGLGGGLVPSWDVLGLGVPPGDVLSSGVGVFPGDVLRSAEGTGTPGKLCHDPKGPTQITVAPHTDPEALGHPQAHTPATPLPPVGHSPGGEHRGAIRQWGPFQALALGFQLVSLGWQRWQRGSCPAVGRGLLPKGWQRQVLQGWEMAAGHRGGLGAAPR